MIIRSENSADIQAIGDIHTEAFHHTLEKELIENLRNAGTFDPYFSLVADDNGTIAGHILFNKITIDNPDERIEALILAPLSVKESYRGKGVGTLLMEEGIKRAKEKGYKIILVSGHKYYDKFGFKITNNILRPNPVPKKYIRALELEEHALDNIVGVIHYPLSFLPLICEWQDPKYM